MNGKAERYRIHTVITRSAILHVEDALEIGKLRLFALSYKRGEGAKATAYHFLDVADARVIMRDLATGRLREPYTEYKGSRNGDGKPISRVLTIKDRGQEARNPIVIELANGPGEVVGEGAIKPAGKPTAEVAIFLSRWEARKLALAVLEWLQACAVVRAIGLADQRAASTQAEGQNERAFADPPGGEPDEPPVQVTATDFWRAAYGMGFTQEAAKGYIVKANGDWGQALALLLGNGQGGGR